MKHQTKELEIFCSAKGKISVHWKSNVIYTVKCHGSGEDCHKNCQMCNNQTRSKSHQIQNSQYFNTFKCEKFIETITLHQLPDIDISVSYGNIQTHIASAVSDGKRNLDWPQVCFPVSFYIKLLKPEINANYLPSYFNNNSLTYSLIVFVFLEILITCFNNTAQNVFQLKIINQYHQNILPVINNSLFVLYFKRTKILTPRVYFMRCFYQILFYYIFTCCEQY